MNKQLFITLILALLALSSTAQKLPDWIINKPTPTNSTYLYVVESATGQTEMQARNRAIAEVFRSTAMRIGQPIDSEEINRALQQGTEYYVISSQYNVPINKVCEYTDNKTSPCRVYVLCQVAKAGNIRVEFDDFSACFEGANKYFADEALYADGFTISQNGKTLSDREIRTMFANSNSYSLYDEGIRSKGYEHPLTGVVNTIGAIAIGGGIGSQIVWVLPADTPEDKEEMKNIAKIGLYSLGVGALVVIGSEMINKVVVSSGKAKIRKAVNLYNNGRMYSQSLEIDYGLTANGVYLTFSF